uniref:Uncharacterized protein n=1 Tax=Oryza glumipatula TaxID=40148 RepID=A0A0D9Z6J6_9ORYZ
MAVGLCGACDLGVSNGQVHHPRARQVSLRGVECSGGREGTVARGEEGEQLLDKSWAAAVMNLEGSVVDEGGGTTVELIHSGERLDGLSVTVDRGLRGNECRESVRKARRLARGC